MSQNQGEQRLTLGFLSLHETTSADGYLGAILVTDVMGRPQEFRCTHPVKPNSIQRTLYGDTLESYVGVDLCGLPLLQTVQIKPFLLVVDREFLLGVRRSSNYPAVLIHRATVDKRVAPKVNVNMERMNCPSEKFSPIAFGTLPGFDDATYAKEMLREAFHYMDPIEPFDRIAKVVDVLGKQDKRFQ